MPKTKAMVIVDRKKNIFKLQQGQYVASEKVEVVYAASPVVGETFLYGDSTQNFAVAVISVKEEALRKLAEHIGIKKESLEDICHSKQVRT